jgi:hypothetical protein
MFASALFKLIEKQTLINCINQKARIPIGMANIEVETQRKGKDTFQARIVIHQYVRRRAHENKMRTRVRRHCDAIRKVRRSIKPPRLSKKVRNPFRGKWELRLSYKTTDALVVGVFIHGFDFCGLFALMIGDRVQEIVGFCTMSQDIFSPCSFCVVGICKISCGALRFGIFCIKEHHRQGVPVQNAGDRADGNQFGA